MPSFLKTLRKSGGHADPTPQALATSLDRAGSQTAALEQLVGRAEAAAARLQQFEELTERVAGLQAQLGALADGFTRARDQQQELARRQEQASTRLARFDADGQRATQTVEQLDRRIGEMRQLLDGLVAASGGIAEAKHQLAALKALSDQVTQKSAALEQQRDAIDHVAARAENLATAMQRVDEGTRAQHASAQSLVALEARVHALRELHEQVLARSDEFKDELREMDQRETDVSRRTAALREALRASAERFEHDIHGLEGVNRRIGDLRAALGECETRTEQLGDATQHVTALQTQTGQMLARASSLAADLARIDESVDRAKALHGEVDHLKTTVEQVAARMERVSELKPTLDQVMWDFTALGKTGEAIKDGVEKMRLVYDESERLRDQQAHTKAWLESTGTELTTLQHQVQQLNTVRPVVEGLRRESERIGAAMEAIESQKLFVEETHRRLGELAAESAALDERSAGFQSRLELVESRFTALTGQAAEAERVAKVVSTVASELADAQHRASEIERVLSEGEIRMEKVETLADRIRELANQLAQREEALGTALRHLDRAGELRQDAAEAAHRLGEQTRELTAAMAVSEERAGQVHELTAALEDRAGALRFVEKRLADFEQQLARWNDTEQAVSRGLEQLQSRQHTVDALHADIKRLFELAERSAADVQAISTARREIHQTREELEQALTEIARADQAVDSLDARKRQMEQVEHRLARADALAVDVRASLEVLSGQKALVDHAMQQVGSLTFHAKQAEALIERLREERDVTDRVRAALEELRSEEEHHAS